MLNWIRKKLGLGCVVCGVNELLLPYDGKNYCSDDWPGYQSCATLGCNHYYIEHGFGETVTTVYAKEGSGSTVGDKLTMPQGCMNAGCPCRKFTTGQETADALSAATSACCTAYWDLGELEGVEDIETDVEVVVSVNTRMNNPTHDYMTAVFEMEQKLQEKFPTVMFAFSVTKAYPKTESSLNHEQNRG